MIRLLIILTLAQSAAAASIPAACGDWPSRKPWQWTDEERLDKRFDERCLAARRAEAAQADRRDGSCQSSGHVTDFVFGTDTPELYLPGELFDTLLHQAFVADAQFVRMQRHLLEERSRTANLRLPERFWPKIEEAAGEYLSLLREQHESGKKLDTGSAVERGGLVSAITEWQRANCAARNLALARARMSFEADTFDQFLYVAVAPGLCTSGDTERTVMSWVERGCP